MLLGPLCQWTSRGCLEGNFYRGFLPEFLLYLMTMQVFSEPRKKFSHLGSIFLCGVEHIRI